MGDEPTSQAGAVVTPGGQTPPAQEPASKPEVTGAAASTTPAGPVSSEQVDALPEWAQRLVKDLRQENSGHRRAKTDAEKAAQAAEEKRLAEEKRWQELAEKRQAELLALQTKLQAAELAQLQRDAALAAGLPVELAGRLQGSTREELDADAKTLKRSLGATNPGAPAGPQRGGAGKPEDDGQVRKRFGIREPLKKAGG